MKTFLYSFLFFLILLVSSANSAQACSCALNETVDKDFLQVPNIAVFRVQSVEKYAEGENGYGYGGIKQSILTVEKVFKGNLKVGQELTFGQGGGSDCIWTFDEKDVGQEFLFYLGEKPVDNKSTDRLVSATTFGNMPQAANVWMAFTCSRSGRIDFRVGDVKYLENVTKLRGKTRLSGVLGQYISIATEDETAESKSLSGYKVIIKGNGKNVELKTDENGFYEIYDLPAGKYTVSAEKIIGYKTYGQDKDFVDVVMKPKSHTEQNFSYVINNRLSGKFFDSNGKPLYEVCLDLIPARGKKSKYFYQSDCTEKDGSFEFDEIPAGTYILVINEENEISARQPFGTFYYPNAVKRDDAAELTIGAGYFRNDLLLTAPNNAEVITVSGVLKFADGKPVKDESVEFYTENKSIEDDEKDEDSRAVTDKNGRFTIRILKGQKGYLLGSMYTFSGEFENCPILEKLIKEKGNSVPEIETPPVSISAESNITEVELKFPFPSCKKAKIE